MATTVTAVTISAVLSTAVIASMGLMVVLCLMGFLVTKELTSFSSHGAVRTFSRVTSTAIVPLTLAFGALLIVRAMAFW